MDAHHRLAIRTVIAIVLWTTASLAVAAMAESLTGHNAVIELWSRPEERKVMSNFSDATR